MSNTIPAGLLGNFYAARHASGLYRTCALTCRYRPESTISQARLTDLLKYALKRTISTHSGLCYGVTERSRDSEALFVRQEAISWDDVVTFTSSDAAEKKTDDEVLCDLLGEYHDVPWQDQFHRPAWKLIVLVHVQSQNIDMVLMDHHAIGDGLSLTVFHRTLWKYLQESSRSSSTSESREQEWPYIVPSDLKPPVFIEDAIKIPKDVVPLLTTEAASPFKPWVGNPPRLAPKMTRVHITTIPLAHLAVVTEYLSTDLQGVSLTGYLHSLMLIHLSRHIPSATCFRGETPFSLRRFALTGSEEMVNHISCIDNDWAPDLVASIRDSWPERESEIIKAVYAVYRRQLKAELRTVDQSGPSFLREVLAIADLERYCEESLTRERGHTYELSNVGVSDMDVEGTALDAAPELSVEKLVFTQCAMVTGPAFGCNVTMVKDGPLTVTLTWQDGIIDEGLLRGCGRFIADAFEERYRASI